MYASEVLCCSFDGGECRTVLPALVHLHHLRREVTRLEEADHGGGEEEV